MRAARALVGFLCLGILLACGPLGLARGGRVEGSGQVASTTRSIRNATRVDLKGSGDVTVVFGSPPSVTIETDGNLVPYLVTRVQGGTLILRSKIGTDLVPSDGIRYTVTLDKLDEVTIDGSGTIAVDDLLGRNLAIRMPGSGSIHVTGTVDTLSIRMTGSGNIMCSDLQARSATVALPGSGEITVWVTTSLDASLSGSGNIRYYGDPAQLTVNQPGSGSISSLGPRD